MSRNDAPSNFDPPELESAETGSSRPSLDEPERQQQGISKAPSGHPTEWLLRRDIPASSKKSSKTTAGLSS